MKKTNSLLFVLVSVVFLLVFGFLLKMVSAEDFDYERAYQDFSYNYSLYDIALNEYKNARAEYLQFETLTSKDKAKTATLKMLQARDEVIKTYLTSIRMKIKESKGLSDGQKEGYYPRIDEEFKYYESHKDKLSSAGSLEDLVKDSEEESERYESSTKIVVYTSLIGVATGKTSFLRQEIEKSITDLKAKIAEIREAGDKNVSAIERSVTDLENKVARSKDKDNQAKDMVNKIKVTQRDKASDFDEALQNVQDSYLYLKEVNTYLLEIVRQIKTN